MHRGFYFKAVVATGGAGLFIATNSGALQSHPYAGKQKEAGAEIVTAGR